MIGGDMTSPVVVFGRAMLLGLTAQGDPNTCYSAYPSCPRDPDRLLDYLNNHRGGIFRFFSATGLPAYYTQQYSQARIQTSFKHLPRPQTSLRPPRVTINADNGHRLFLPQTKVLTHKTLPPLSSRPSSELQRPLTFPGDRTMLYSDQLRGDTLPEAADTYRREQLFAFPDRARAENSKQESSTESYSSPVNPSIHRLPPPVAVYLPDRTGTGELRLDNDESTFGSSSFPARYRRYVSSSNSINTLKQRMVFPSTGESQRKIARKMKFPTDTQGKAINFPSGPDTGTSIDSYRKPKQDSTKDLPIWNKPKDDVTRDLVKFPKSTDERENRHVPKIYLMKFPSDNSFGGDSAKISFNLETSKNKKDTRRMKFPVEYSDQSGKLDSNQVNTKDNDTSKVKFHNIAEGFRETSSGIIFPNIGVKVTSNVRFLESTATG